MTNTYRGSITIIIIVLLVIAGTGGLLYMNRKNTVPDSVGTGIGTQVSGADQQNTEHQIVDSLIATPTEIFLDRNTDMNNAQSFDDMVAVMYKYDSPEQIADAEAKFAGASKEKKAAFFGFAVVLLTKTEDLSNIQETITGDTALVVADTKPGAKLEVEFVNREGLWKMSKSKIVNR